MRNILVLAALSFLISSCGNTDKEKTKDSIYWVNSLEVNCEGVAPRTCLQVQKGDELIPGNWETFYAEIKGFEFEAGYIYKLRVEEKKADQENIPADASTIEYILIEQLEKRPDKKVLLNDIWILKSIMGEEIAGTDSKKPVKTPQIEINVAQMKYFGNDGCNIVNGSIKELDDSVMKFGIGISTRKACPDMTIADKFDKSLTLVVSYKLADMQLSLFDEEGNGLMILKKTD